MGGCNGNASFDMLGNLLDQRNPINFNKCPREQGQRIKTMQTHHKLNIVNIHTYIQKKSCRSDGLAKARARALKTKMLGDAYIPCFMYSPGFTYSLGFMHNQGL